MKERDKTTRLPGTGDGRWWGSEARVSQRLKVEFEIVKKLFNKDVPTLIHLPPTRWDIDKFELVTHKIDFGKLAHPQYDLAWTVNFSMRDDPPRLCKPDSRWTMKIFYPESYPYDPPEISFLNGNHATIGSHHANTVRTVAGKGYRIICHYDHNNTGAVQGHDPSYTNTAMHAERALLWLRSHLYTQKHNLEAMPHYHRW